jgi:putative transposase
VDTSVTLFQTTCMEVIAMPWIEKDVMRKKLDFITDYETGCISIAELSRRYTISRKTAYKYIKRYKKQGVAGLEEQSRSPKHRPNTTSEAIVKEIVDLKLTYPLWGPKKIVAKLSKDNADKSYPCPSTAQHWLDSYGLVKHRRKRQSVPPFTEPFVESVSPNISWSMDYKGQFKMGNGKYCYPLTLVDNYSRYLFLCVGLISPNFNDTRQWLEQAFRIYGLPDTIRSDNGQPFASASLTGLTKLSIWFIQLGIRQERIELGHPEQNGRLERLHRTLKEYIEAHPQANLPSMQQVLNMFLHEYNEIRPHESIGFSTPAGMYSLSHRRYPEKIYPPEYDYDVLVRKVQRQGMIGYNWKKYMLSSALIGEYVGLKIVEKNTAEVYYYDQHIATLDLTKGHIHGIKRRAQFNQYIEKKKVNQP